MSEYIYVTEFVGNHVMVQYTIVDPDGNETVCDRTYMAPYGGGYVKELRGRDYVSVSERLGFRGQLLHLRDHKDLPDCIERRVAALKGSLERADTGTIVTHRGD